MGMCGPCCRTGMRPREMMQEVGPPHSPRPIPVLTVPGAPGVTPLAWSKARTQRHTPQAAERRKLLRILHTCTD